MSTTPSPQTIAAVDLGSNSFHLIVATLADGQLQIVDRLKETVRLGSGLDTESKIDKAATERAQDCLARFGQRIRDIPNTHVRIVGTNALRRARNRNKVRSLGEKALGHKIEIISGREEARLIYAGVSHSVPVSNRRQLVVDIGGGSTELIIGENHTPIHLESLYMGCVSFTERYFPDGKLSRKRMDRAMLAARQELEVIERDYRDAGWDTAIGSSGTLVSIHQIIAQLTPQEGTITRAGVEKIAELLCNIKHIKLLELPWLPPERAAVFPGGVAIAAAVLDALNIGRMEVSGSALREGLLYDLIDRIRRQDVRDVSVDNFAQRFGADLQQAARVANTSLYCFDAVADDWELDPVDDRKMLTWACKLHEIGFFIAHNQHHKHGAYIAQHYDLRGFSRDEQDLLARLIRYHRRKISTSLEDGNGLDEQPVSHTKFVKLACLLRLAVVLHRNRSDETQLPVNAKTKRNGLRLKFDERWLKNHPLTVADLEQEANYLRAVGLDLVVTS